MDTDNTLTPAARWLGYAGLLPQILCVALAATRHEYAYTALAGGFAYAAAIFSFLGGVWWGQAIAQGKRASAGVYLIAVLPSLLAVALFLPWSLGWDWPAPALLYLGALIAPVAIGGPRTGFCVARFYAVAGAALSGARRADDCTGFCG